MSCFYFESVCWDLYTRAYITYINYGITNRHFVFVTQNYKVRNKKKYYRKRLVCYNIVKAGCVAMKQNFRDVCTKVFVRLKGENHSVHLKKNPCNYQEQWMLAINLNGNRYTSICRMSFSTSEISITVLAVIFSAMASRIKRYGDISVIWL